MLDNLLRQQTYHVAKLLGRPIQDCVEILGTATSEGTNNQAVVPLQSYQTTTVKQFTHMTQNDLHAQLHPQVFRGNLQLYQSYMRALDTIRHTYIIVDDHDHDSVTPFQDIGERKWQTYQQERAIRALELRQQQQQQQPQEEAAGEAEAAETEAGAANITAADTPHEAAAAKATNEDDAVMAGGSEQQQGGQQDADAVITAEPEREGEVATATAAPAAQEEEEEKEKEEPKVMQEKDYDEEDDEEEVAPSTPKGNTANNNNTATSTSETVVTEESESSKGSDSSVTSSPDQADSDDPVNEEGGEEVDPGIEANDTFAEVVNKLSYTFGWDEIEFNTKTVWVKPGRDPDHDTELVRGRDYFDEKQLKAYLKKHYGWTPRSGRRPADGTTRKETPKKKSTLNDDKTPQRSNNKASSSTATDNDNDNNNTASSATKKRSSEDAGLVTPSPNPLSRPRRDRRSRTLLQYGDNGTPLGTSRKKPRRDFEFESAAHEEFYNFPTLIKKLQERLGWAYKSGKFNLYNYVLPGRTGEGKGGIRGVDYFVEEEEVIEYCTLNKYYENRRKLGLDD
jgi:hypothetical protein